MANFAAEIGLKKEVLDVLKTHGGTHWGTKGLAPALRYLILREYKKITDEAAKFTPPAGFMDRALAARDQILKDQSNKEQNAQ